MRGVTPAGIHTLHTLPPQAEAPAGAPGALPIFAPILANLLARQPRGAGGPDAR